MTLKHAALAERLLEAGLIAKADLALGQSCLEVLLQNGRSEQDAALILSQYSSLLLYRSDAWAGFTPLDATLFSVPFLKNAGILPLFDQKGSFGVVLADPSLDWALGGIQAVAGEIGWIAIGLRSEIVNAIEALYGQSCSEMENLAGQVDDGGPSDNDAGALEEAARDAPVIRMVNMILSKAQDIGASDIHLEPFQDVFRVRYRVDGVLRVDEELPLAIAPAVCSRIKLLSRLNIAERRVPQDGRFKTKSGGKEVDLRVSTLPTLHGESVVMRVLSRESISVSLPQLGLSDVNRDAILAATQHANGLVLVTGPTGSGKTTTLYAVLNQLDADSLKIVTVEDPVEYELPGINQVPVRAAIGMTFASALTSILRQDPDVVMVGEIRDRETASIAVRAALTGHLVLATLHTNDAISAIPRLIDMGVDRYLVAATLRAVVAQRLVRRLCPQCGTIQPLADHYLNLAKGHKLKVKKTGAPAGCPACRQSGFKGRTCVAEVLSVDDTLREAIAADVNESGLMMVAKKSGYRTMLEDGLLKCDAGETAIDEIMRAVV